MFLAPRAAGDEESFRRELEAFGMSARQIDAMIAKAAPTAVGTVEVFGWLATALKWFLAMSGQWRRDAAGIPRALDYSCLDAVARHAGLRVTPEDFAWLQVLEQAVLDEIASRRSRFGRARR